MTGSRQKQKETVVALFATVGGAFPFGCRNGRIARIEDVFRSQPARFAAGGRVAAGRAGEARRG